MVAALVRSAKSQSCCSLIQFSIWTAACFNQINHCPAHCLADVHVGLGVAVIVAVGGTSVTEGVAVNRGDIALELGVLTSLAVYRKLGFEDQPFVTCGACRRLLIMISLIRDL